ncbi:lysozyme inhibitor LprI family protein [Metabacillus sp. RGM 3146]|uniref:lysozyme inhibitor LprI family protein n=1 Tax=Metabacillus sp. RGM 3146 TaxID=3401092 RepID=UPI003B9D1C8A
MKKMIGIFIGMMLMAGCGAVQTDKSAEKTPAASENTKTEDQAQETNDSAAAEDQKSSNELESNNTSENTADTQRQDTEANKETAKQDTSDSPVKSEGTAKEKTTDASSKSKETAKKEMPAAAPKPVPAQNKETKETTQKSKKEEYIKKLNAIEKVLASLDMGGTTLEMEKANSEIFSRWDNALNEIYGVLKQQLSADDMTKLREDQRKWLQYRDETAKKNASKYEGGTMGPLEYVATQAKVTKERDYDLVEGYMK